MPSVIAVLLIVTCEPDLVHCAQITHWPAVWETVEACKLDKPWVLASRKPGPDKTKVTMSKCRLYLNDNQRFTHAHLVPEDRYPKGYMY